MRNIVSFLLVFFISMGNAKCQDKYFAIQEKLMFLAAGEIPALNEKVDISVTNVSIQEFLRAVANNTGLNINVDPELKIVVINNFTNVKVIDILMFLCRLHDLNISATGNIINIFKEKPYIPKVEKYSVKYNKESGLLSVESDNEDLSILAKAIVNETGVNVVPAPGLDVVKIKSYIRDMPLSNALDKLAYANNLKVSLTEDNVYLFEKKETLTSQPVQNSTQAQKENSRSKSTVSGGMKISRVNGDSLSVIAEDVSISDIIKEAAELIKADYFFTTPVEGTTTLNLKRIRFASLLDYLFWNTSYTYQIRDGVYVISDNKSSELRETRIIQLQNRTIDTLLTLIPLDLKQDLELKEFPELNSLLVDGMPERINALELFVTEIDKVVPNILIEVMIIDARHTNFITTGIESGIGEKPKSAGTVFPGLDINVGSQSINNLIQSFNGFGSVKIGNVTPDFYINLRALEESGVINIRSTPKLSTLNGHAASLTIGNTEYYKEEQNNIYGSITSQSQIITTYKDVKAELSVKIRPVVSGDDQITLEIEVTQEDFTTRISQFAPPGKVARTFKSLIRVKNEEMVLLGGLEEKRTNDTGSGVPFFSKIPVLKWFFSSRTKDKSDARLNIFIKPSIVG